MKLSRLLAALPQAQLIGPQQFSLAAETEAGLLSQIDITHIVSDSRQVGPGALFVAYHGVTVDGHRFMADALARGAVAIVCEELKLLPPLDPAAAPPVMKPGVASGAYGVEASAGPPPKGSTPSPAIILVPNSREALAYLAAAWHNFPSHRITMVGITGTDGKTTTTNFLYQMLQASRKKVSMINTVNAVIGDAFLETGLHTTTPDAPDIQRYLAEMVNVGTEVCLLETTSHGLAQRRVTACNFDVAIITNITHEHLDLHSSLEAYWAAKASLFESLATSVDKGLPKTAILNCDDRSFEFLKQRLAPLNITWLGYTIQDHPEASLKARNISYQPDKTLFTICAPNATFEVASNFIGDYNISNCLAAATAAIECFGLSPDNVRQGVAALKGIPGRMERIDEGQPFLAIVDFAHTPNSLQRALSTAKKLVRGRVIVVFGCAGLRDVEKRRTMGQIAAELADLTIITAEDPRTEDLASIIAETATAMQARGAVEGEHFERVSDRGRAIYRAVQLARPGDLVIALGKGHEQSMCFGQVEYPWDDRQAMRAALQGQPLLTLPTANATC